jgi:hypothetical protein
MPKSPVELLVQDFRPLLREWKAWTEAYSNEVDQADALYWYNERATLGTLAAAAVRKNLYVLEEYAARKTWEQSRYSGRADLWIRGTAAHYVIEAKQLWVNFPGRTNAFASCVNASLEAACADARCHEPVAQTLTAGVVFLVPRLAPTKHDLRGNCMQAVRGIGELLQCHIHEVAEPMYARPINEHGYLFPGVACFMRLAEVAPAN